MPRSGESDGDPNSTYSFDKVMQQEYRSKGAHGSGSSHTKEQKLETNKSLPPLFSLKTKVIIATIFIAVVMLVLLLFNFLNNLKF